eukprot:4649898-Amphidinium_carterae.2
MVIAEVCHSHSLASPHWQHDTLKSVSNPRSFCMESILFGLQEMGGLCGLGECSSDSEEGKNGALNPSQHAAAP